MENWKLKGSHKILCELCPYDGIFGKHFPHAPAQMQKFYSKITLNINIFFNNFIYLFKIRNEATDRMCLLNNKQT